MTIKQNIPTISIAVAMAMPYIVSWEYRSSLPASDDKIPRSSPAAQEVIENAKANGIELEDLPYEEFHKLFSEATRQAVRAVMISDVKKHYPCCMGPHNRSIIDNMIQDAKLHYSLPAKLKLMQRLNQAYDY